MHPGSQPEADRLAAIWTAQRWASTNFVVLDTETTGLGHLDRIVEVSCIDKDGHVLVDTLVNPGMQIPASAVAIHGITDADVAGKPAFPALWPSVWNAVRHADCVLTYNAAYDCRLIRQSLSGSDIGLSQAGQLTVGCIMELYGQFYGQYSEYYESYKWQKLVNAVSQCGLQMNGSAHRALADSRASLAVLKYMASIAD